MIDGCDAIQKASLMLTSPPPPPSHHTPGTGSRSALRLASDLHFSVSIGSAGSCVI